MQRLHRLLNWAATSWATRSLAVGALATLVDIGVLLFCDRWLGLMTPISAAIGVMVGATLTFFLNRHFAFRDHHPELAPQAMKFVVATGGCMVIHATLVGLMRDRAGVPVVLAKLVADLLVFSVGQLLLFRYVVFPKKKTPPEPSPAPRTDPSSSDVTLSALR
ncbi:MAG: GtrA family protein [Myxococcaceae bacterium]